MAVKQKKCWNILLRQSICILQECFEIHSKGHKFCTIILQLESCAILVDDLDIVHITYWIAVVLRACQ